MLDRLLQFQPTWLHCNCQELVKHLLGLSPHPQSDCDTKTFDLIRFFSVFLSLNRIAVGKRIPFYTFAIIPHNPPRYQTCICIFWIVFIFVCFLLWINYCARLIIVIKNQPRDAPTLSCANSSFWPMECRRAWQRSSHACRYQHSHLRTDRQSRHRARLSR